MNRYEYVSSLVHESTADARPARRTRANGPQHPVSLHRGFYMHSSDWGSLDDQTRYYAKVLGYARACPHQIMCHESAASIWGIPIYGPWPQSVHRFTARTNKAQSVSGLSTHRADLSLVDTPLQSPVKICSVARTLVDLARVRSFASAVCSIDWAMGEGAASIDIRGEPRVTQAALFAELRRVAPRYGAHAAAKAIRFSRAGSGSVGESISRALIHQFQLPAPQIQQQFMDAEGRMFADFWWPQFGLIGEFDGLVKYNNPSMTRGRIAAELIAEEKHRESRLRAASSKVKTITRWGWSDFSPPETLATILRNAGLRPVAG